MSAAVAHSIDTREHLADQAGTGTGKSLAYLLPAIAAAPREVRTVVVTSSRALQDQLASVDLPFLAGVVDVPFRYSVLKGRSNYLCEAALSEVRVQPGGGGQQQLDVGGVEPAVDLDDRALREQLETIVDWAERSETGDQA